MVVIVESFSPSFQSLRERLLKCCNYNLFNLSKFQRLYFEAYGHIQTVQVKHMEQFFSDLGRTDSQVELLKPKGDRLDYSDHYYLNSCKNSSLIFPRFSILALPFFESVRSLKRSLTKVLSSPRDYSYDVVLSKLTPEDWLV